MQTGNCFRCNQNGHWIIDCPLKSKSNDDPPPPWIHCPCGGGLCDIKLSNTHENPGRRFYKCPAAQKCTFFKWCDKVTEEDIRFRPDFTIPDCPCGSGPCRRSVSGSGPDAGRAYLQCGVRKGFGACGFFKWVDDVADEVDFWVEADLVLSDVESSFLAAAGVPENAEDDSSVSDVHSAAGVNQGVLMYDTAVIEPGEKLHGDCAVSKLSVDEATSCLGRDTTVSNGSVAKREMTCYEQFGEAEWSFPNLEDLMEQYNSEKVQFESISGKHAQVLSAFMSSYSRLRILHEKTSHLRKLLVETEKEMACCEAETLELGTNCREVAGEMADSQNRMQVMAVILGDEVEALKQKEFAVMKRRRRC
ncbi:unnamed protein product [Eruca vesicaria subsp. sativa]|uniref:CCHC-type domain-containing protein n=1 Tax=Eruca vesicaria subsp. sativa TaxID=29727 RepID=A0ABC8IXD5_ERUVS|nr:unnamed protein product [Eruca vesicaria subsp. sativa]